MDDVPNYKYWKFSKKPSREACKDKMLTNKENNIFSKTQMLSNDCEKRNVFYLKADKSNNVAILDKDIIIQG